MMDHDHRSPFCAKGSMGTPSYRGQSCTPPNTGERHCSVIIRAFNRRPTAQRRSNGQLPRGYATMIPKRCLWRSTVHSWLSSTLTAITQPTDHSLLTGRPDSDSRISRIIAHRGRDTLSAPENIIENLDGLCSWIAGVEI